MRFRQVARLVVYERMIDDERRWNAMGLLSSLNMLVMTAGGFDYTSADCMGLDARVRISATCDSKSSRASSLWSSEVK